MFNLIEIFPAIMGFYIAFFPLSYFMRNHNSQGIVISSFAFILSGFLCQILVSNIEYIKKFSTDYEAIFKLPFITILATASGIFMGNLILKYFVTDKKERKEFAILFMKTIDLQIQNIAFINSYLSEISNINKESNEYLYKKESLEIYLNQLENDKYYETAFKKIGIYDEKEIEMVHEYSIWLRNSVYYTKRSLLKNSQLKLEQVQISVISTFILGSLCSSYLADKYLNQASLDEKKNFYKSFDMLTEFLDKNIHLDIVISKDFINRMKYIKGKFQEMSSPSISITPKEKFYVCIMPIKLNNKDVIITFIKAQSEEEAKQKGINSLKPELNNTFNINDSLNIEIISPWE
ncbi:MAG: hypothetical protein EAZ77_11575 [Nostocales cyanobacterium]|nr:MAG: hypothetical protein EAZ77_11575 [Nostocales cyanobacterium]